jgi:glutathionyl-hydroquinone reductase
LYEDEIKELFVSAMNKLMTDKASVIADVETVTKKLMDTTALDAEAESLKTEMDVVSGLVQKLVADNAAAAMSQDDYGKRYDALVERFDAAKAQLAEVESAIADKDVRLKRTRAFLRELRTQDTLITEFDERIWHSLVEKVTVYSKGDVWFTFKDGSVIAS